MRRTRIIQALGILMIVIVTSIVTATFAGQIKRAGKLAPQPSQAKVLISKAARVPRQEQPGQILSVPDASGHMKAVKVEADGDILHVMATAYIQDSKFNLNYIWSLRIFDPGDKDRTKPLLQRFYIDQKFRMSPDGEMVVNFEEAVGIPLPRKRYSVEVSLLLVPLGANPEMLKTTPAKAEAWQGPISVRPVVVGQ
jgi:hypothetical protein